MEALGITRLPPLMERLDADTLDALRNRAIRKSYAAGQIVHSRGDAPGLTVIESGSLDVGILGRDGRLLSISRLGPGHAIGDHTVFAALPRTHDVMALTDTSLLQLSKTAALRFSNSHPAFREALLHIALVRGHILLTRLDAQCRLPRDERVAVTLLTLAAGSDVAHIQISQSDLAAAVGLSRQSLSSALSALTTQGFISKGYGEITLLNRERLQRWINRHIN